MDTPVQPDTDTQTQTHPCSLQIMAQTARPCPPCLPSSLHHTAMRAATPGHLPTCVPRVRLAHSRCSIRATEGPGSDTLAQGLSTPALPRNPLARTISVPQSWKPPKVGVQPAGWGPTLCAAGHPKQATDRRPRSGIHSLTAAGPNTQNHGVGVLGRVLPSQLLGPGALGLSPGPGPCPQQPHSVSAVRVPCLMTT